MIAAEVPVVFARACEMFILELTHRGWAHAEENACAAPMPTQEATSAAEAGTRSSTEPSSPGRPDPPPPPPRPPSGSPSGFRAGRVARIRLGGLRRTRADMEMLRSPRVGQLISRSSLAPAAEVGSPPRRSAEGSAVCATVR